MKKVYAAIVFLLSAAPLVGYASTQLISVGQTGNQSDLGVSIVSMSANGRYIAFGTDATNLVTGDTNGTSDIFVRDVILGTTTRVSVNSSGNEANGVSQDPTISSNGQFIVFISNADNLVPNDTNGFGDVFIRDIFNNTTTRVSVNSSGVEGDDSSFGASISSDGNYVVFTSNADNLVPNDTNGQVDIFVRDIQAGTTIRVSVDENNIESTVQSDSPTISSGGQYVAFVNYTGLVAGDTNNNADIFIRDIQAGTTTRVSVDSNDVGADNASYYPHISDDGRYVEFASSATNLVPNDTNNSDDIFVRDIQAGTTIRVSVDSNGVESIGGNYDANFSRNGRYVTFTSDATNLVSGDTNNSLDIFVRDLINNTTRRINIDMYGNIANGATYNPHISEDGKYISYISDATNFVLGDTNIVTDAFIQNIGLDCSAVTDLPSSECTALIDFYQSTSGSQWTSQTNWLGSGDNSLNTVCDWNGISCNNGHVSAIELSYNNLGGTLPASLSGLTEITSFSVMHNNISGLLPSSLSAWTNTQSFNVSYNSFSGALPSSWSAWGGHIVNFYAMSNNLSGLMPGTWSTWTNINQFNIRMNNIGGSFPTEWSTWTNIGYFDASHNIIGGPLPSSWSTWINVSSLIINNNNIGGLLPNSWSGMTGIHMFNISHNQLTGTLPSSYSARTSVGNIDIGGNVLKGDIPTTRTSLTNLNNTNGLLLDNNCLNTTLPNPPANFVDQKAGTGWKLNQTVCPAPTPSTPPYTPPAISGFGGGVTAAGLTTAMTLSALMNGTSSNYTTKPDGTIDITPTVVGPDANGVVMNKWMVYLGTEGNKMYAATAATTPLDVAYLVRDLRMQLESSAVTSSNNYIKSINISRPTIPMVYAQ